MLPFKHSGDVRSRLHFAYLAACSVLRPSSVRLEATQTAELGPPSHKTRDIPVVNSEIVRRHCLTRHLSYVVVKERIRIATLHRHDEQRDGKGGKVYHVLGRGVHHGPFLCSSEHVAEQLQIQGQRGSRWIKARQHRCGSDPACQIWFRLRKLCTPAITIREFCVRRKLRCFLTRFPT